MSLKVIVTNESALRAKYGAAGFTAIASAVQNLIAADSARGLDSQILAIDDPIAMQGVGGAPVTDPSSTKQNKDALDAVYAALLPHYVMLLGSVDIIPHQELVNPTYRPGVDDDRVIPSDLPYACEAPHGRQVNAFAGPTRVVGRLPDVTGGTDPAYLVALLSTAATWRQRPATSYQSYFSVSAQDWQAVTSSSLAWIFGNASALNTSPALGPNWTAPQIGALFHFINCHGDVASPVYFGSGGGAFPPALDAGLLAGSGLIQEGTIGVSECCYGGQLFDPGPGGQAGMANVYLGEGAYAFFASSSVSYGPEVGSAGSGLICQMFGYHVLDGSSTGRATLEARQDFVAASPVLSPIDLKTLAQFNLMGDPSIHPAAGTGGAIPVPRTAVARAELAAVGDAAVKLSAGRALRRDRLAKLGAALASVTPFSSSTPLARAAPTGLRRKVLDALAPREATGGPGLHWTTYPVRRPRGPKPLFPGSRSWRLLPDVLHVATGLLDAKPQRIRRRAMLIAYDDDGTLVVQRFLGR